MAAGDRIAMALASDIAPMFDTSATYLVGSYVIHGNRLYRCTTDHYGAWDASHFTAVNVGGDLKNLRLGMYPFIIEQPEDSDTPIGGLAVFIVESLSATSYQWQEKSPDGNWVNSTDSGATIGTLMVPITAQNVRGYKWRCRLKNANGKTVFTNAVTNNPKYDLAPAFDSTGNYAVGSYTIYSGILYRCTTAHTGNWDASHFEAVNVGDDIVNYLPTLFAPAGFGWGAFDALRLHKSTAYPPLTQPVTTLNTFLPPGFYYYTGADTIPADGPTGLVYGAVLVLSLSAERTIQFVMPWNQSADTFKIWTRRGRMTSGGASFEAWAQIYPTT